MNNNYSQKVRDILKYSREEAERLQNNYIGPEHLMLGIIRSEDILSIKLLTNFDIHPKNLKENIDNKIINAQESFDSTKGLIINKNTEKTLKISVLESRVTKSDEIKPEHIILAILRNKNTTINNILSEYNIDYRSALAYLITTGEYKLKDNDSDISMMGSGFTDEDDEQEENIKELNNNEKQRTNTTSDTPVLDNFGIDITKSARENLLDPIVGRKKEIDRITQILCRRKKNNPILIGEPGVGKSAIVEGLALRIIQKKVSRILFDKRVITLDMASVVSGTKYRGQFEERIKAIINEVAKNPNVILFIDEIHTIVGAGGAAGSLDAANMLKPALARGEIQCIGATTLDEYRKNIEKDGALERRFQKILVSPTTKEETLTILKNIRDRYEEHHNVRYTDNALELCVKLSDRYITDRNFPDKAIDTIDEAGARSHIVNIVIPKEIEDLEAKLKEVEKQKFDAVKSQKYELAASYRDEQKNILKELVEEEKIWQEKIKENPQIIEEENIADVVALISGVPVSRIEEKENDRLKIMKDTLQSNIIGQDDAVSKVVKAIQRNRIGLKNPNKPIGTFMFLGPTGVGKTHLAKKLAEFMFDSTENLIRVDMSEYMEKFNVSRLVGAPPGYVGYEEGGLLTEKVRRHPYSVVLFDEIEKAHSDVFNILLQILDEGHVTDSLGRKVDFKNTVIIMTSNIGTRQLKDFGKGIGFHAAERDNNEYSRTVIQKALNKSFSPEFINRVDEIIMFDQLSKESIYKIIDIELGSFYKRINEIGYYINLTDRAKEFIAKKGYDIQFGARPLKRAIQKYIEDEMAEIIIENNIKEGKFSVDLDKDEEKIVVNIIS